MTLRVRLLLGLVVLAAIGLTVAGGVTYHEQETFLSKRVNDQLISAVANPRQFSGTFGDENPGGATPRSLPFGTYAELRFPNGTTQMVSTDSVSTSVRPTLPATVTIGRIFTVHHPSYRALSRSVGVTSPTYVGAATLIVAIPLRDMSESLHRLLLVELIVALSVLVVLAVLAWWVIKFGLRPLEHMQETAGAIAAGDLSRRIDVVDEHTEVGRLGVALNEMMQQIESAFAARAASEGRLRRFVGDASHELRTPLTSIRGYAELFRRGAADRPEDLAKAMRRIEEEAEPHGFARRRHAPARPARSGPAPRTPAGRPDAHHARRGRRRTRRRAEPADRLHAERTRSSSPATTRACAKCSATCCRTRTATLPPVHPCTYASSTGDDEAVIEVADEGPGMATDDANRVFERFWRSDPSRTRSSGGAGLGLAIVAAIAAAHGGRAEVQSAPGQGSTFRVHLPKHRADHGRRVPRRRVPLRRARIGRHARRARRRRTCRRSRPPSSKTCSRARALETDDELAEMLAREEAHETLRRAIDPFELVNPVLQRPVGQPPASSAAASP